MGYQTWEQLLNTNAPYQTTNGTAYNTSIAATDVSPAPQLTLPGNFMYVGQLFRFTAYGIYSTTGTPTLTLGIYYGGVAGTSLGVTAALTTPSGASSNSFSVTAQMRVTALGSSGTVLLQGSVSGVSSATAVNLIPATTSTGGSTSINTTNANALTLGATWGTSSSSNTLTVYQWTIELLN